MAGMESVFLSGSLIPGSRAIIQWPSLWTLDYIHAIFTKIHCCAKREAASQHLTANAITVRSLTT